MSGFWGDGGPYASWTRALHAWARHEPADLAALPRLKRDQFDADTWERLTRHVLDALDTRLTEWSRRFALAFGEAPDEFSAGRELTQARVGLRSLRDLADHPGLPDDLRTRLGELMDQHIRSLQTQMEHAVSELARSGTDPHWVDQRLRTLRDNAFTSVLDAPPDPPAEPPAPFARLRRRLRFPRSGDGREPARTTGVARPSPPAAGDPPADHWSTAPATAPKRRIVPD
ncbi:hypothetical protein [Streptomyces uncialis]|uniref:hypothetical protein n=1 Tax=Streptomyces uncialis TaxID=1048205 RepID=UPI00093E305A|nr:hypothetical protein [Streptomyces uncialis]